MSIHIHTSYTTHISIKVTMWNWGFFPQNWLSFQTVSNHRTAHPLFSCSSILIKFPGMWGLRELADEAAIHHIWEVMVVRFNSHWLEKGKCNPIFKNKKKKRKAQGIYRLVNVTLVPGKKMEQILLESLLKHMENKEATGDSQHILTQGKSCLTNLVAFHYGVTALVSEARVTDTTYLHLCKVFDISCMTSLSLNWGNTDLTDGPVGG